MLAAAGKPMPQTIDYEPAASPPQSHGDDWYRHRVVMMLAFLSFPPGFYLILVYPIYLLAAVHLGRFPTANNPDPYSLPGWVRASEHMPCAGALVVPVMLWVIARIALRRHPRLQIPATLALTIALWTLVLTDPFGALWWFLD